MTDDIHNSTIDDFLKEFNVDQAANLAGQVGELAVVIAELEAENERLREALVLIDDNSSHYVMTPTYSEGRLRHAHQTTRNLARAALKPKEQTNEN